MGCCCFSKALAISVIMISGLLVKEHSVGFVATG